MNTRSLIALLLTAALGAACAPAFAQDAAPQQPDSGAWRQGQRGGRGLWGGLMGTGRGLMGTVTAVAADRYTIRTETGEVYTIHFSVNTHIIKQRLRPRAPGDRSRHRSAPEPGGPEFLKSSDIKVGDIIAAGGEVDQSAHSVGAVFVVQLDPERARQMRALEANYGKTWLMGRVTAIDGVKVTLEGIRDKAPYAFTADENTTFRHRRQPITLADVHIGDLVRVEGAIRDGVFLATTVADIGTPQQNRMPPSPPGTPPQ